MARSWFRGGGNWVGPAMADGSAGSASYLFGDGDRRIAAGGWAKVDGRPYR